MSQNPSIPAPPRARFPRELAAAGAALGLLAILASGLWEGGRWPVGQAAAAGLLAALVLFFFRRHARRAEAEAVEKERLLARLRAAEMKYRSIFDNASEGIFQTTPDGRFLTANRAMARMHGYGTPEEMMAALSDVAAQLYVEPAQRAALLAALQHDDIVSNFEFEIIRADGRTMWVRENVHAVRDENGALLYLEGTVEDVSDRWWGEQRRRLQYATARAVAEAASVEAARLAILRTVGETLEWDFGVVWDVDADAGVLRCVEVWSAPKRDGAEFAKVHAALVCPRGGRLAGEVWAHGEPRWLAALAGVTDYPGAAPAVQCGMASAFAVPLEVGGEVGHVLEFFSPKIAPPDDELRQTLDAISSQLSYLLERKRSEEALRRSEMRNAELAAVVAHSNDAMIACTLDGTITGWNFGAAHIYGFTAAEILGQPLPRLIPPERLDEFPQTLKLVRGGESLANYESVRLRKDGRKINVSLTDSPIRGANGEVTGFSSIARDITERKRLEEDLLQAQKMDAVGRLAGGIAHDFNNILTAILGYSDLIIGQIDERQWMYKHLSEIRKAADFAASLTHQLLAFSRRQPLFLRVFNLNDTVRSMQKMLQRVIGENIAIRTQFMAETGRLKADPSQLEQVLLNLCVNARDAMPKGGEITIQTADVTYSPDDALEVNEMPAGEYVKLTVADTGHGMTPEVRKHIFEPFFTTKEKGQGTGLGLATCYGIVKQSGGYITVDSAVDAGTTFAIYLPRVEESGEKAGGRKEIGQLVGGTETVLYVEDEITVRSLTAHVLRRLGYTVLEAADGKSARDAVESNSGREVDLLFSDVVLPDSGGQELARWMRQRHAGTRILFTSGYADENILRRHGLEPHNAFLQKPFTPAEIARKVREVIDGPPP